MTREQSALIGLLGCALRGERPEAGLLAGVDQELLYAEAGRHMVAAMTGMALEDAALPDMDAQAMERWKQAAGMGRYRRILMDRERETLLAFLEEQGIWYLPLKGILLQELYPRFGMREMADNDILYDVHGREALRRFMIGRGYEASPVRMEVHDDFRKPPLYHFEMHTRLFEESFDDAIFAYYEDTARLLRPDGDRRFGRHMSEEDFFLYFLAHAYRHFAREGTGLRTLTDCALFLRAREELLDRDYLDRELRALGLTDFAHTLCGLSRKLFERPAAGDGPTLTAEEQAMLDGVLSSGVYGTWEQKVDKALRRLQPEGGEIRPGTRLRYVLRRLFPEARRMRNYNAFVQKHPWALPAAYVERIVKCAPPLWKQTLNELRLLRKAGKE